MSGFPLSRLGLCAGVGLLAAGALLFADLAAASCAPPDSPRLLLGRADAAFVGSLESTRTEQREEGGRVYSTGRVLRFRVRDRVKGPIGEQVEVRDASPSSSISLSPKPGEEIGLLLQRQGDGFAAHDCHRVLPGDLRSATVPIQSAKCGLGRRPRRRYGNHAPEAPDIDYRTRPIVIGCGRLGETRRRFELVGYQLGSARRSSLCIDTNLLPRGPGSGCGGSGLRGGTHIDITGTTSGGGEPPMAMGALSTRVARVLVRYRRAADGRLGARDGAVSQVPRRLLRRIGERRPFGRWTVELPTGARLYEVEARDRRGRKLESVRARAFGRR